MSHDTAVMAGGIRFYLCGRTAYPLGPVVHKFQTAMISARTKLASAIAAISGNPVNLDARQQLVLEYCFNPNAAQLQATYVEIRRVLSATLTGLRTADLKLHEPDPAVIPAGGAEGYVVGLGRFRGAIHTRFDLNAARTLNNVIHEATHKFARTVDRGYLANNIDLFLTLRQQGIPGNAPITNANGLLNADSYSAFTTNLT
ncbi:hypothetical protein [Piscinibacter sakaiensis]|uniref:hypothetical protein n=1 Tax=Piscinibacter sakaiensis TaxID=1547922 RepID=UPI003AAF8355